MHDFGVRGFQPEYCRSLDDTTSRHGPALAALLGRRLTRAWVGWNTQAERWNPYIPVLLDSGSDQLEITWSHFEAVSVTWNSVDPAVPPRFEHTQWTHDRHEQLNGLRGQLLWAVDLLERPTPGDIAAIGLAFSRIYLAIADGGGGWNRMEFGPPASHYRQRRIASMPPTGERPGNRASIA
jgi:hypothetical protein